MDSNALPLPPEAFGWLAAGLTWLTFFCRDMRRLRVLALSANAAFIAYAAMVHLWPVLVLHLALVPVNLWRLTQVLQAPAPAPASVGRADGHAAAEEVAVPVDVVHAADPAPVLLTPQRGQRVDPLSPPHARPSPSDSGPATGRARPARLDPQPPPWGRAREVLQD